MRAKQVPVKYLLSWELLFHVMPTPVSIRFLPSDGGRLVMSSDGRVGRGYDELTVVTDTLQACGPGRRLASAVTVVRGEGRSGEALTVGWGCWGSRALH